MAGLLALGTLLLAAGCADIPRVAKLERAVEVRDDKEDRLHEENARLTKQLEQITQRNQQMAEALERMSRSVAALNDKLAAQDVGNGDPQRARDRRRTAVGAGRLETSAECAWLGKRSITVLINDDLIAADGFTRLYNDLGCPMDHLAQAFGCAVPAVQLKDRALAEQAPAAKPAETTEAAAAARREAQQAATERRDRRIDNCWKSLKSE